MTGHFGFALYLALELLKAAQISRAMVTTYLYVVVSYLGHSRFPKPQTCHLEYGARKPVVRKLILHHRPNDDVNQCYANSHLSVNNNTDFS